jgi:transposase InsO family protein
VHCSSSAFNAGTTMRTARFAALHFLPSSYRRKQGQSGTDAATGRTVSGIAVLRKPQVRCVAGTRTARSDQPKTRATTDAADGHRSLVPEAEPESSSSGTRDLSVSAARCPGQPAQPGRSIDITYIPMRSSFLYLVAIMDWFSRFVLSWDLSNTMEVDFCRSALEEALRAGRCEIFNSDQGVQFTSRQFLQPLKDRSIRISMDGRGRAIDNVFIERLWRSVKYELIYPGEFDSGPELWSALARYFDHYNFRRPHQALHYRTPAELYLNRQPKNKMR